MTSQRPKRIPRELVPANASLCDYCTAKCCRYFALPIDTPDCAKDLDFIRWYLLHDRASVFVEGETWYLLVHTTCKHLQDDNRCGIYLTRPQICRDYTTAECEYEDLWTYDQYFETPEQIQDYMDAMYGHEYESLRSPKPSPLPIA
ncbi:MAG: YkgJ family cysteine cluster protein [Pirellulaceae bacterium]